MRGDWFLLRKPAGATISPGVELPPLRVLLASERAAARRSAPTPEVATVTCLDAAGRAVSHGIPREIGAGAGSSGGGYRTYSTVGHSSRLRDGPAVRLDLPDRLDDIVHVLPAPEQHALVHGDRGRANLTVPVERL